MSENLDENNDNAVSEQEETNLQNMENAEVEDPFFGTGHFSMHHQPEDDDVFIGE